MIPSDGRVVSATGVLAQFAAAGVLEAADVHVAKMVTRTGGENDPSVALAVALTVRALRAGSVCLPLDQARPMAHFFVREDDDQAARTDIDALPWPDPLDWLATVVDSPLVGDEDATINSRPLRCVDGAVYLERYWCDQESIRVILAHRAEPLPAVDESALTAALDEFFPGGDQEADQRRAVAAAVRGRTTVIAGGPGTGKTRTISWVVEAMRRQWMAQGETGRIALAAPTGKAAARLTESLRENTAGPSSPAGTQGAGEDAMAVPGQLHAVTLHRLLGARPGRGVSFGPARRLPYDLVVVDEMSMVSLSLMARLLEALSPSTRLVMVGDADQLTPVDAGAVLADITAAGLAGPDPLGGGIVELRHGFRFDSAIAQLADAVRRGDADATLELLRASPEGLQFDELDPGIVELDALPALRRELELQARGIGHAATSGDGNGAVRALEGHRLLCAHRTGVYGVSRWSAMVQQVQRPALASGSDADPDWFTGRPLLATRNMAELGISNGDTGVVIATPEGPRAAMSNGRSYAPFVLEGIETMFAMTIHKSQGSQFDRVTVVLPGADSPLLTRELLYTAITRARRGVRIIGLREAIVTAVRTPARRASGLTDRLQRTSVRPH